jgi:hypothetical protein
MNADKPKPLKHGGTEGAEENQNLQWTRVLNLLIVIYQLLLLIRVHSRKFAAKRVSGFVLQGTGGGKLQIP